MRQHRSSDDSFEGSALTAAQARREARQAEEERERYEEQRRRVAHFTTLMQDVFGEYWLRMQDELGTEVTEIRRGDLLYSLVDVEGERAPVLSVAAQCRTCGRNFEHHPIKDRADVGEILEQLQAHPDCVSPTMRAVVARKQAEARRALNMRS